MFLARRVAKCFSAGSRQHSPVYSNVIPINLRKQNPTMPALVDMNALSKEVIVIDDSPPTPSHTGIVSRVPKKRKRDDVGVLQDIPANGRTNGCNVKLGQKRKGVRSQAKRRGTDYICNLEDDQFSPIGSKHVSNACSNPQSRSSKRPPKGLITYSKKQRCESSFKKPRKSMLSVTFSMEIYMLTCMKSMRYPARPVKKFKVPEQIILGHNGEGGKTLT